MDDTSSLHEWLHAVQRRSPGSPATAKNPWGSRSVDARPCCADSRHEARACNLLHPEGVSGRAQRSAPAGPKSSRRARSRGLSVLAGLGSVLDQLICAWASSTILSEPGHPGLSTNIRGHSHQSRHQPVSLYGGHLCRNPTCAAQHGELAVQPTDPGHPIHHRRWIASVDVDLRGGC